MATICCHQNKVGSGMAEESLTPARCPCHVFEFFLMNLISIALCYLHFYWTRQALFWLRPKAQAWFDLTCLSRRPHSIPQVTPAQHLAPPVGTVLIWRNAAILAAPISAGSRRYRPYLGLYPTRGQHSESRPARRTRPNACRNEPGFPPCTRGCGSARLPDNLRRYLRWSAGEGRRPASRSHGRAHQCGK